MEITSLYLKGYKYLRFSEVNEIRIINANKIEVIIGINGGGKSSLLRAYSPIPMQSTVFDKHGSKELIVKHHDHIYTLGYDAGEKAHSFIVDDGPNLNESGTTQVQEELVEKHLGYNKLIEKLIYNKMKMTQMTPAARMDFLISINPVDIKFMKDKHAKLLSQAKKYKNQLELLQTRVSEYKTAMMDEIEYSKYLNDRETIQQFDDYVIKNIYRYEALAKQCADDLTPIRDLDEYKEKYLSFKHFMLKISINGAQSWVIPKDMSLSEMIMEQNHLEHQKNTKLLQMSDISKEIDELETLIAKSNQVDISSLEKQYEQYSTSLKKYTDIDWSQKVIIDWPPKDDTDAKYTELHKLHNLINDCNNYFNNTRIWHLKTFKFQKDRYLRIHNRIQDISNKVRYVQQQISDIEKQVETHECSSPDKNCTSTTCSFKIQYNCILGDLRKKYQELTKSLDKLNESYLKWTDINSKMNELLTYQSTFLDNSGILNLIYECILNISPLFSKVFIHGVDTLVDMVNVHIDQIFSKVKDVLQDSNDYHEKLQLENKIKELDLTITAQKKNMSLAFANKKVKEDYETLHKLEDEVNHTKSMIETYKRYIDQKSLFTRAIEHTEKILKDLDNDVSTYTNMAKHEAYTSTVRQLNELHSHVSHILRDMDTVIDKQKRNRESFNKEFKNVELYEKEIQDIQTMCKVLDPYSGLPAIYTKKHLEKILQNVNYFISQVFTYPLIVSLQEDTKDMKYKFIVQVDTVNAGDISTCSDGQMEMIDLAFTLAIMIALGIHTTYPIFLDEIGRCLDVTHMQRLLELLHHLVEQGYINQMFIINHQAVMISGFESADVVCLRPENVVLPEKYNTTVTIN